MANQKFIIKRLEKIITEIRDSGISLRKVILFGSYAKNTQHRWSDVDVALVADEFKGIDFYDVGLISRILIKYPTLLIQPRTYNPSQFTPKKDPMVEEILKTGIEIKAN
ncbi:MAG: nucleotidyltransferase domain-containing protein [Bacteroidetes bacterium]|nr:nucleotidyltransferase domain-containing protein [Bacteroidota bacterium]